MSPQFTRAELERSFPFTAELSLGGDQGARFLQALSDELGADVVRTRARNDTDEVRYRGTLDALMANLLAASTNRARPDAFVAVSFDRNTYTGTALSKLVLQNLREALWSRGLVEGQIGFQTATAAFGVNRDSKRTRLRPTAALRRQFEHYGVEGSLLRRRPRSLVRIRDPVPGLEPKDEPPEVQASRLVLARINARLGKAVIELPPDAWRRIGDRFAQEGDDGTPRGQAGDPTQIQLFRAFVHTWQQGGRIYGGWFQSVPKTERPHLTIDGKPTVELDYARLHPTLLFHRAGIQLDHDVYSLPGYPGAALRDVAKTTFQRLINRTPKGDLRLGPMRAGRGDLALLPRGKRFQDLVAELQRQCAPISRWFETGEGLFLQYEDSVLMLDVLERLEASGVLCLPIHDGAVVQADQSGLLLEAMEQAFRSRYGFTPLIVSNPAT